MKVFVPELYAAWVFSVSEWIKEVSCMLIDGGGAGEHGAGSASGAARQNICMLKQERASAIMLVYLECAVLSWKTYTWLHSGTVA